ncbi:MAG: abortive infection family protein [Planctomycetota bacterium]|nr:MAG: abortive infection family protein [Planctomycetota bacterium]
MADGATAATRFQMVGARAAVSDGPIAESIEQQISAIENALESVPDFAFDLSKTLVESVCKTVLADIGQPADPNWDGPKLLRETTNRLSMLPRDHPDPKKARESVEKTIRGLLQTIQGLCELRNNYGMASHGRDGFSARLDLRQATLAAQAADTIVSFLYRIHRDALMQTPGARVYYEDHADFNEVFDRDNEPIRLGELELLPSRVLFHADREAYKAVLNEFIVDRDGDDEANDDAEPPADEPEATP